MVNKINNHSPSVYPNNGRIIKNNLQKINRNKHDKTISYPDNGKSLFSNINQKNIINKETSKSFSWILNTINPINHLPVVGTISKLYSKASASLDIAQSAIGGFLYGGPLGVIKGIGSWVAGKFINNDNKASKNENIPKEPLASINKNAKSQKNIALATNPKTFDNTLLSPKEKHTNQVSTSSKIDTLNFTNNKKLNLDIIKKVKHSYFLDMERDKNKRKIDLSA